MNFKLTKKGSHDMQHNELVGCESLESSRVDIRATTIPQPERTNPHASVHTLEHVGSWPRRLEGFSSHVHYILDMGPDTHLRMAQVVVAILDQSRKESSSAIVEGK